MNEEIKEALELIKELEKIREVKSLQIEWKMLESENSWAIKPSISVEFK